MAFAQETSTYVINFMIHFDFTKCCNLVMVNLVHLNKEVVVQ